MVMPDAVHLGSRQGLWVRGILDVTRVGHRFLGLDVLTTTWTLPDADCMEYHAGEAVSARAAWWKLKAAVSMRGLFL